MAISKRWLLGTYMWYRARLEEEGLGWWDRRWQPRVTGACPVAVSLTTHGKRLERVHIAIQSIMAGSLRPRRLILWLDTPPGQARLSVPLLSLQQRGLEIRFCENFGPHTKYYPYVCNCAGDGLPLVTADDDVLYPRHWLRGLWQAHLQAPSQIHCWLARRILLQHDALQPYNSWTYTRHPYASPLNLALGFGGVIYPVGFQALLRREGEAFRRTCPRNDDVWLHVMAIRNGYCIHPIAGRQRYPLAVTGSQEQALWLENVDGGGNDAQIWNTYQPADLALLRQASQLQLMAV